MMGFSQHHLVTAQTRFEDYEQQRCRLITGFVAGNVPKSWDFPLWVDSFKSTEIYSSLTFCLHYLNLTLIRGSLTVCGNTINERFEKFILSHFYHTGKRKRWKRGWKGKPFLCSSNYIKYTMHSIPRHKGLYRVFLMNFWSLVSRCRKTPSLLGILLLNGDPWERGVRGDMVEGKGRHNKTRDERDIWENAAAKKED